MVMVADGVTQRLQHFLQLLCLLKRGKRKLIWTVSLEILGTSFEHKRYLLITVLFYSETYRGRMVEISRVVVDHERDFGPEKNIPQGFRINIIGSS